MRVLSLFSGGGLGDYGLTLAGMEIVGQVEIDDYCQKILKLRWPDVPKWTDIKNVTGKEIIERCGPVDLVSGGFPCQDISVANPKGVGIGGGRSGLWKEQFRIICEIRPRYCLVENSPNLLGRGLGVVLGDLAKSGYDSEWECLPASAFGAPHQRDRVWIVAYPEDCKWRQNNSKKTRRTQEQLGRVFSGEVPRARRWPNEPEIYRMDDGAPNRLERFNVLGNGQFVDCVEWIGKRILEFDRKLNPI